MHVVVIGGGISGLATARRLLGDGHETTLVEATDRLGGLGGTFSVAGCELEKFYHCVLPQDDALRRHIDELGLSERLLWRGTSMGFVYQDDTYSLNTPKDVLTFSPLRPWERLRLGMMAIRARLWGMNDALDDVTAAEWIRQTIGNRAFEILWKPLLSAKIGDHYPALPALWLTSRLHREKNVSKEEKGCLVGGYRGLTDAFENDLRARGARIELGAAVEAIREQGAGMRVELEDHPAIDADCVISTVPLPHFQRMARPIDLPDAFDKLSLDYQGVISGVFLTTRELTPYYWAPWVDCGTTSQGLIGMSALVPLEHSAGLHVNYLVNYTHRDGDLYRKSDDEMLDVYERDLLKIHPEARGQIADRFLFRASHVEPMWTVGYQQQKPPHSVIAGKLYTSCTAQLYPRVNSWNSCCEVADEMIEVFRSETGGVRSAAGRSGAAS